jgi:hypothetical protein
MSTADEQASIARMTITLQVVAAVMVTGLVGFLAMVAFVRAQQKAMPPVRPAGASLSVLTPVAVGFGVVGMAASVVIPGLVATSQRRRIARGTWQPPRPAGRDDSGPTDLPPMSDTAKLANVYQGQWIIGASLNEGPAFFALIAYMIEGHPLALGVALLLGVGLALRVPTRPRVESWIEQQRQLVAQERQFGG